MNKKHLFLLINLFLMFTIKAQENIQWTLEQCIEYAVENNINVNEAIISQKSSEITYNQSKVALFPNLSASASYNLTNGSSIDPITSEYVQQLVNSANASIGSRVTLYSGSQLTNTIKKNRLSWEQSQLSVDYTKNNITLNVTQAYLTALLLRENIVIEQNNIIKSQKQLEQAQAKYDIGVLSAKDLADIKSQYFNDQYNLVSAQNNYDLQVLTIKQLLELDPLVEFDIVIPVINDAENLVIPSKADVWNKAAEIMPEVQVSKMNIAINEQTLKIQKGSYYPTLSLSGSLSTGYTNTKEDVAFGEQIKNSLSEGVGLSLSIPIFSKHETKSKVEIAKLNIQNAELQLKSTNKELYKSIESTWQSAVSTKSELTASSASLEAANASYQLAQQQFDNGALSATDLLISQNTYMNAEQNYLQKKYYLIMYYQLLQFYLGNEVHL